MSAGRNSNRSSEGEVFPVKARGEITNRNNKHNAIILGIRINKSPTWINEFKVLKDYVKYQFVK